MEFADVRLDSMNRPTPDPSQEGKRPTRSSAVPLLGGVRGGFMVSMRDPEIVETFHEPAVRIQTCCLAERSKQATEFYFTSFSNLSNAPSHSAPSWGLTVMTSNELRTTSRAAARDGKWPSAIACTRMFPRAVHSAGPAMTGSCSALAAN